MTLLTDLQDDLQNRLRSCPEYDHVSIQILEGTSEKAREAVRTELNRVMTGLTKTNGKGGLGVLILLPRVRVEDGMQGVPGPQLQLACSLQVVENKDYNQGPHGTGISAQSLAATTLSLLHLFQPRGGVCLIADENAIDPADVDDDLGADQAFEVNLMAPMSTKPADKVPAPTLAVDEGTLTLTGAEGAAHWFTTDGRYPRPNADGAHLYAGPVSVTTGTLVRAASYASNFSGSDVMELIA